MKRLPLLLTLIALLLLSSCMKGDFTVEGSSLEKYLLRDGEETRKYLKLELYVSETEASYSYVLKSPDQDLKWEGDLYWSGKTLLSDELLCPVYLDFPEGDYGLSLHSSKGGEADLTLSLGSGACVLYTLEEAEATEGVALKYFDMDGDETEKVDAHSYEFGYLDRYGTHVTVRDFT